MPTIQVDDVQVKIKQKIWQSMFNTWHRTIVKTVNGVLGKQVPDFINRQLHKLNAAVDNEDANTFVTGFINEHFPVNMTMTKAPEFRASDDLIEVHLDGLVVDSSHGKADVNGNDEWQARLDSVPQLEQFLLHESVANSFMFALSDQFMPLMVQNEGIS